MSGANAVRLYGNNPEFDHKHFLDEAEQNKLMVIPGMSDFPYFQDQKKSCVASGYDCFSQIKKLYGENLKNGFLTKEKHYHPALSSFILINEPDLKMPQTSNSVPADVAWLKQKIDQLRYLFCFPFWPKRGGKRNGSAKAEATKLAKAIVSSFDAVLAAEEEAGVVGQLINFTATFSYAICTACPKNEGLPALGQMLLLEDAMKCQGSSSKESFHFCKCFVLSSHHIL